MKLKNSRNGPVIEILLNRRLTPDPDSLSAKFNLDKPCPFSSREFPAIQWQLYFPHLVVAFKGHPEKLADLIEDFFQVVRPRMKGVVTVGDYVRARLEVDTIRPYFGLGGMFGSILNKQIPLDELTTAVMKHKIAGLFRLYNVATAAMPLHIDPFGLAKDWRAIQSVSEGLALSIVVSYCGREATPHDQPAIEYLAEIIYETWHEVDRVVSDTPSE